MTRRNVVEVDGVFWMVIHTDGSFELHADKPELEALQQAVGGDIESVPVLSRRFMALAHEEGKLVGLPYNSWATQFCETMRMGDILVGDVVFIGSPDSKGASTPLPVDVTREILFTLMAR